MNMCIQSPEQIRALLTEARESCSPCVVERLMVILRYAEHPESIAETCEFFGISRTTLANWLQRLDPANLSSLDDRSREPKGLHYNSTPNDVIEKIRSIRTDKPLLGKERIAELLRERHGIDVSASTVGRIIDRECLYFANTPYHLKKRLEHKSKQSERKKTRTENDATDSSAEDRESSMNPQDMVVAPTVIERSVPVHVIGGSAIWRFVVMLCVITNVVFAGFLVATATMESWRRPSQQGASMPSIEARMTQPVHAAPSAMPHP